MRNWEQSSNITRGVAGALLRSTSSRRGSLRSSFSLARTENPADLKEQENSIISNGPELLLTPVVEYVTNRDDSPARSRHRTSSFSKVAPHDMVEQQQQHFDRKPYAIAVEDILVVNCTYSGSNSLHITTLSSGFFEFSCGTANGHDILLAFLQASLDPERIIQEQPGETAGENGGIARNYSCGGVHSGGSSVTSCLDIDALQAQHLEFRATAETWPEKLSRRVGHVFQNLQELSGALCDGACCPTQSKTTTNNSHHHQHNNSMTEPRTPPPSRQSTTNNFQDEELEIDDSTTDCSPKPTVKTGGQQPKTKPPPDRRLHNLPSGLSVEDSQTSN